VLGAPSIDYTAVDIAGAVAETVLVPLPAGAPRRRLQPIVDETEPAVLAASVDHLDAAIALCLDAPSVRRLVVLDHDDAVDDHRDALSDAVSRARAAGSRLAVETVEAVVARGRHLGVPPLPSADPERLATVIYTSGSSGSPKGAMQPERLAAGSNNIF